MSLRLTYGVKMSEITNNSTGAGFNKGAAICAYVCLFLAMCSNRRRGHVLMSPS